MTRSVAGWVGVAVVLAAMAGGFPVVAAEVPAATQAVEGKAYYGRVVTEEGKAVAGARVFLVETDSWTPEDPTVMAATADGQGCFRMPARQDSAAGVLVQAEGFALAVAMLSTGATEEDPNEIEMGPPAEARVRYVDAEGKAVAGVQVAPRGLVSRRGFAHASVPPELQQAMTQRTDANGECVFGGMPAGTMVRLEVQDDRWAQGYAGMNVTAGEAKPATVTLQRAGEVRGRVVIARDGSPAARVRIGAQGTDANRAGGGGSAVTDAQGNYHLKRLSPGEYNLALELRGELKEQYTAAALERVTVEPGQALNGRDFALVPGGFVAGRAYVEGSGEPLADIHIGVYGPAHPKSSAWVQGMQTAKDGTFLFRVPPGEQYVYNMAQSPLGLEARDGREMRTVKVKEGETVKTDFVFRRVRAPAVRGRVVDGEGKSVAEARVSVELGGAAAMSSGGAVKTDAEGKFEIAGVPDGCRVTASRGRSVTEQAVVIGKGNRDLTLMIKPLRLASARVVVCTADGKPAAGVKVSVTEMHGQFGMTIEERTADAEGVVLVRKLSATNQYSVRASGNGFGVGQAKVDVRAGEEVEVRVTVPKAESFVAGEVVDEEGKPLPDVEVGMNSDKSGYRTVRTDADGRFRFAEVVAGDKPLVYVSRGKKPIMAEDAKAGKEDVVIIVPKEEKKQGVK